METMQARSPFPIPIFSLNLSTHSINALPVSAHAWLFKTPQIHPLMLMRTCKSGHLFHTHTQYTFHTHFYYHHSLSTPPCTRLISLFRSPYPHSITTSSHSPHHHTHNPMHDCTYSYPSLSIRSLYPAVATPSLPLHLSMKSLNPYNLITLHLS